LGVKRAIIVALTAFVSLYLFLLLGPIVGLLTGILLVSVVLILTRPRKGRAARERLPSWKPMSLRKFIGLLWLVALVAILYSPSALRLPLNGGGTIPASPDALQTMSPFITYLHSSHRVVIANTTQSLLNQLNNTGKIAFLLIGPDEGMNLTKEEARVISNRYLNGTLSLLIAEGNSTNNSFLNSLFHVEVKGDAIRDPNSPFQGDGRVFTAPARIGSEDFTVAFDVASPIILENSTSMRAIARTSSNSSDVSFIPSLENDTMGPRIVAAVDESNGSRAILVSDSAPFSTAYNASFSPTLGVDEKGFVKSAVQWVTNSDENTTIVLDNTHYNAPVVRVGGSSSISLPIGRLFTLGLEFWLSSSNGFYSGFLQAAKPFAIALVLFTTWSVYGMLTSRYANERRGKDDEPLPGIERTVLAESREKMDFLKTSRTKGFYVATLQQLYEILNDILLREFGSNMSSVQLQQLVQRLGEKQAKDATRVFSRLSKIAEYAEGKRRFLLPPVFRWKQTTGKLTGQAEKILNTLGLTMTGMGEKKQVEYKLRRG
jgi:hypothetical protein